MAQVKARLWPRLFEGQILALIVAFLPNSLDSGWYLGVKDAFAIDGCCQHLEAGRSDFSQHPHFPGNALEMRNRGVDQ